MKIQSSSLKQNVTKNLAKRGLIIAVIGFLILLIIFPIGSLFVYASQKGVSVFWDKISSPEALFALKYTLLIAICVTAINAVIGTLLAYVLVKYEFPGKHIIDSIVDLPMAIPCAVIGFSLLLLYGPIGLLGEPLRNMGIRLMFSFPGILIAHLFVTFPFVVRAVGPLLKELGQSHEEAAKMLGANSLQTFGFVTLPSIKGGIIAGSILTFARSFGEFGATIMVSGNLALKTQTAPLFIFSQFNSGDIEGACAMSLILILISFMIFFTFKIISSKPKRKKKK